MPAPNTALAVFSALSLAVVAALPSRAAEPAPLPLFDAHVHYSAGDWASLSVTAALARMAAAGTRMALVSSTPDTGTEKLYRAAPDRVVAELRPYRTTADMQSWHRDPRTLPYLRERLKLGIHKGIGEFHLHGDEARSAVIRQVVALAVARDLVLHAHSDAAAVRHLFAHDARIKVLWAHAGFDGPKSVGAMVDRYSNLWVELAIRDSIGADGALSAEWRALFLRRPDRFLIGTDTYTMSRWERMPDILGNVRRWLSTLPRPVAEKLAWRNAARLYGLDPKRFR